MPVQQDTTHHSPLPPPLIPVPPATPPRFEDKNPHPYIPMADLDEWADSNIEIGTIIF